MRLKLISRVFICVFAIILMSHNSVSAIADGYIPETPIGRFKASLTTNFDGSDNCSTQNPRYGNWIYTNWDIGSFNTGRDYLVAIPFFNAANSNSFDGKIPAQWSVNFENWLAIKETSLVNVSPSESVLYLIITKIAEGGSGYTLGVFSYDYLILYENECVSNYGWTTRIQWTGLTNYTQQLNGITQEINALRGQMPTQTQINNLNNSVNNLNDAVTDHYRKEDAAIDNINGQTPSDIGNTSSQETTSLIGVITNFINALRNLSATNCNVSLQFPQFAGGTQVVNVCQNKEYTGNIVSIAGSIFLVVFYIPIAYLLLRMIYNEIRSYTNG